MAKNKFIRYIWIIIPILIVAFFLFYRYPSRRTPSAPAPSPDKIAALAQCLKDQGALFYGAFWCPHCANQKQLFGASANLLPYVECSTPDGQSQLPVCQNNGITGYPTWVFKDGSRLVGEIPLNELAAKSGCPSP